MNSVSILPHDLDTSSAAARAADDHAPWELAPFPTPSEAQLHAICEKHEISARFIRSVPPAGVINSIYLIDDNLILRVAKDVERGWDSMAVESVAAPTAFRAGVKTPELLIFDADADIVATPFTIFRRAPGQDLGSRGNEPHDDAHIYRELGADLAHMHARVLDCPGDERISRTPERFHPDEVLEELARRSLINDYSYKWLQRAFHHLAESVSEARSYRRFLHNDAGPTNVMAHNGRYSAVIDWGDAGWGDPALEFRRFPYRVVPAALEGYREVMPLDGDEHAEARIFYDHLGWSLLRLTERPGVQTLDWEATQVSRLLEVLLFALTSSVGDWFCFDRK